MHQRPRARALLTLIVGVVLGTVLLGSASAITSSTFTYAKKHVGYRTLTPADLRSSSSALSYSLDESGMSGAGCHFGGIRLPQGAIIVSVTVFETEGVAAPLQLQVFRINLSSGTSNQVTRTPATTGARQAFGIPIPATWSKTNNASFEYLLSVCHDPAGIFHGARVKYTFTSAGD